MITRAIRANRPMIHNIHQIHSIQSTITGKNIAQKPGQITSTGFQLQAQSNSVELNRNINKIETTKSISPTELIGISNPTSFALIPAITIPMPVSTKFIRSNSDIHNETNTCEKLTSQDNSSGVTSHQFQVHNTATLPFSQFIRTQRNLPRYNTFTDYINQIQNNRIVTNQSNRSNDQTFMLNTKTTPVPTMSRPPLVPLNIIDTYT